MSNGQHGRRRVAAQRAAGSFRHNVDRGRLEPLGRDRLAAHVAEPPGAVVHRVQRPTHFGQRLLQAVVGTHLREPMNYVHWYNEHRLHSQLRKRTSQEYEQGLLRFTNRLTVR